MIVIFIVKSMQFYMKQHEFWSMQVKLLYILFLSLYLGGNIVIIGGVTGTLTMNWGSIAAVSYTHLSLYDGRENYL